MIFVSSFRPFSKCTPEIAENQIRAFTSWLTVAERIIYVGNYCDELASALTEFVPFEGRPPIKMLAQIASTTGTWAVLINSDIVITEKLKAVEQSMNMKGIECGVSERFDLKTHFKVDMGLDFFCGKPHVWKQVALRIPEAFRIGCVKWDNWTLGFLCTQFGRKCADLTPAKFVFHPKHGDREGQNWEGPELQDTYCLNHRWPSSIIYA